MKKIVKVAAEDNIKWELCGSLKNAREVVENLITRYGEDAAMDIDAEYADYGSSERSAYVRVFIRREETDEEYMKRLIEEEKWRAAQEERDKAEFIRLQERFAKDAK